MRLLKVLPVVALPLLVLAYGNALDRINTKIKTKNNYCSCKANQDCPSNGAVFRVSESNWRHLLEGEWLLGICMLNLEDCQKFEQTWQYLVLSVGSKIRIGLAMIDISKDMATLRRLQVKEIPLVYHVKQGEFRKIKAQYDHKTMLRLVEQNNWQNYPALPFWQQPTSVTVSFYVFAHEAAVDLWRSGAVGTDFSVATWCITFMLSSMITTVILFFYLLVWLYQFVFSRLCNSKRLEEDVHGQMKLNVG